MNNAARFLSLLVALAMLPSAATANFRVWYVDSRNTSKDASPDGRHWADAFPNLETALTVACPGDSIWVAAGTYYAPPVRDEPDLPSDIAGGRTFLICRGIAVYGGFRGISAEYPHGEAFLSQRDPERNPTILSGAIAPATGRKDAPQAPAVGPGSAATPRATTVGKAQEELKATTPDVTLTTPVVTFRDPVLPCTRLSGFIIDSGTSALTENQTTPSVLAFVRDAELKEADESAGPDYGVVLSRLSLRTSAKTVDEAIIVRGAKCHVERVEVVSAKNRRSKE